MKDFGACSIALVFFSLCLFSCSKQNNDNPVAPEVNDSETPEATTTSVLYGQIVKPQSYIGIGEFKVIIRGENFYKSLSTDIYGSYYLRDIPKGYYTIYPYKKNYTFEPIERYINIQEDKYFADAFYFRYNNDERSMIYGRITDTDNNPVFGVTVTIAGNEKSGSVLTDNEGYFGSYLDWSPEADKTYNITPSKSGYTYRFDPETYSVTIRDNITICNFMSVYSGVPLHCVSGYLLNYDGAGLSSAITLQGESETRFTRSNAEGYYEFTGLTGGNYQLVYETVDSDKYVLETTDTTFVIDGEDVTVPEIRAFNDSTIYTVNGKVIDFGGTNVPDVEMSVYRLGLFNNKLLGTYLTDSDGNFKCTVGVDRHAESSTFRYVPFKNGFTFSPDSIEITLPWIKCERYGEAITISEITSQDYNAFTAEDYFPLSVGATWVYTHTEKEAETSDYTVDISEKVSCGGKQYYRLSRAVTGKFTDFRIEDNTVYTYSGDEGKLFLKFGVIPGTQWEIDMIAGTYSRYMTFLGKESITTFAGVFENCAHFEMKVRYGSTSYDSYNLWYATATGLVMSVKTIEENGELLEYVCENLKSYTIQR
nr:hypothetical protein [uncultured Sulfurimonas sp.]